MVFGGKEESYRSTDIPNPLSEYGLQKLESEKSLSSMDENVVVLRLTLSMEIVCEEIEARMKEFLNPFATSPINTF